MPGSKKLIDIIDEMNLKEDTTNKMVVDKLSRLAKLILDVDKINMTNSDLTFVNNMMEDLIEKPYHRITKLQIEKCNNLYKQYKELK
tara:strand:- start:516 stop:776 length:261 start_codon:yes stop_codon:yes gene_type:complete